MEVYEGYITEDYIRAEVHFKVVLPEYCENQQFELYEDVNGKDVLIEVFSFLLNNRTAIVSTENGVAIYTGEVSIGNVETIVICQLIIDKEQVASFPSRKFKLLVL
ncbi:MAG: hypothetical protein H6579_00245 [Chitinophagales bacterium]|nr:hypothetical protein [Chitinophagales bacterium]